MVNAVILAGAPNNGPLRDSSPAANEALIEIYGRPMLDYVVGALNASSQIGRMVIVGPPADFAGLYPGAMLVESGSVFWRISGAVLMLWRPGRKSSC